LPIKAGCDSRCLASATPKASGKVEQALLQGLTPELMVLLAATVALANWMNRFNETFGVELP
jgi:hypothetical protein